MYLRKHKITGTVLSPPKKRLYCLYCLRIWGPFILRFTNALIIIIIIIIIVVVYCWFVCLSVWLATNEFSWNCWNKNYRRDFGFYFLYHRECAVVENPAIKRHVLGKGESHYEKSQHGITDKHSHACTASAEVCTLLSALSLKHTGTL